MRKHAADVRAECGSYITNCEAASMCVVQDSSCSITYCSPNLPGERTCVILEPVDGTSGNSDDIREDTQSHEVTDTPIKAFYIPTEH